MSHLNRRQLETLRELVRIAAAVEPDLHARAKDHHPEVITTLRHGLSGVDLPALQLAIDAELRAMAVRP